MVKDGHTRRSFIRKSATALAVPFGMASSTTARRQNTNFSKFRRLIEQGQGIQQKRGVKAKAQFLRNNGITVKTVSSEYRVMNEMNTISTQSGSPLECVTGQDCESDLRVTLSISRSRTSYVYNVEIAFQHRFKMWDLYTQYWIGGLDPADGCGLTWAGDAWSLYDDTDIDRSVSTTKYTEFNDGSYANGDAYNRGYVGFEIADEDWTLSHDPENGWANSEREAPYQWSDTQSASVFLTLGSNTERSSEIHGSYAHTWYENSRESGNLQSVNYSDGGSLTLNFENSSSLQTVTTQTEDDGNSTLVVDRDDTFTYP